MSNQVTTKDRDDVVGKLAGFFTRRDGVLLAFLFGSFAGGRVTPKSDIDVAVLFEELPAPEMLLNINSELSLLFKNDLDLVVLNGASPILKMQVLKHGIPVFVLDRKYYTQFYTDTVNQYDDLKRIRKSAENSILKGSLHAR